MRTGNTPRFVHALRRVHDRMKGRTELEGAEAGFTLIELMVVLLIMAILLAIAIPTFLGVKGSAQDRAVQSNLTNALTSAKASYANGDAYATAASLEVSSLSADEPNLTFETGNATTGSNNVAVNVSADGQQLLLVAYSQSGTCWAVVDNEGTTAAITGTPSALGTQYTSWPQSSSACSAATLPTTLTWRSHY
jgi:type IV pilus assembly protein PilA